MDTLRASIWRQQRTALFGKLPTVLDYVRIHHDCQAGIELDGWLQQAVQTLAEIGRPWPAGGLRYVFVTRAGSSAIVGVLKASRDRASRKFPVTVYRELDLSRFTSSYARLAISVASFWEAAAPVLDELATLSKDEARERLSQLDAATGSMVAAPLAGLDAILNRDMCEWFADGVVAGDSARLLELSRVLGDTLERRGARALTVDLPASSLEQVAIWLSLSTQREQVRPSIFWLREENAARLLICFGAPPAQLPLWLGDRDRRSDKLFSPAAELGARDSELAATPCSQAAVSSGQPTITRKGGPWGPHS